MSVPVSMVIPSYNGRELLERHLPAVEAALSAHPPGGEVIVADDGSTDGTASWLAARPSPVRVVSLGRNRGFGPACAAGVAAARNETVVLLNTDVAVREGFLGPLAAALEPRDVFAAGALALAPEGDRVMENLKVPRLHRGRLRFEKLGPLPLTECRARLGGPRPTLFATGGFMALKRSRFLELGGFDPLFRPFYYEDADLCWRAWKRGFRVLLVPESTVVHHHRGTIGRLSTDREVRRIQERNRLLFLWKNLTDPRIFYPRHLFPLCLRACGKWLCLDLDFYRALGGALRRLGPALRARRAERAAAKRTDGEVFRLIRRENGF